VKKTKKSKERLKSHDEKTCFRCRLHTLYEELKDNNEPRFMLISMAEACGGMLAQLDEKDMHLFMLAIKYFYEEDTGMMQTRH